MGRKVFISVLGYSNYRECFYTRREDTFKSAEVRYVQEATLQYLMSLEQWSEADCAYILLTEGAEKRNWEDNGQVSFSGERIAQPGLKSVLQSMHLPFKVLPIKNIPDGNNEDEIWNIFARVFELLQEDDELYFDMTHGFRYLPMLILVLGNYSKLLKNVVVKSITYGNYEARNKDTNEAPLIDLLPLSEVQDWTSASVSFLKNGNLSMLKSLCTKNFTPILKATKGADQDAVALKRYMDALRKVVDDMNICRGVSILKGEHIAQLYECSNALSKVIIEPMKPIIDILKVSFAGFIPSENIKNGYYAAKWCFDNQLFQQSLTILHETITSHICESEGLCVTDVNDREIVNKSFHIFLEVLPKEKWMCQEMQMQKIEKVLKNKYLSLLASTFKVTTELRNDLNHAGMRPNPTKRDKMMSRLKERLDGIIALISKGSICS